MSDENGGNEVWNCLVFHRVSCFCDLYFIMSWVPLGGGFAPGSMSPSAHCFFKTTGVKGGTPSRPASGQKLLSQGVVLPCFLKPSCCPLPFPSLWIVSEGGTKDLQNSPWEAHFLTGLRPPILPRPPPCSLHYHSRNDLLQHTSDPVGYRIRAKHLAWTTCP